MLGSPSHKFSGHAPVYRSAAAIGLALSLLATPALACPDGAPGASDEVRRDRAASVAAVQAAVMEHYVFVDLRRPVVEALSKGLAECRYDVADPADFAALVTEDLRRVSGDGHLYLTLDQEQYAALLAPPESDEGVTALRQARAVRAHHGLVEMRVVGENVRYLRIAAFMWAPDGSTVEAYDAARAFLAEGDAVIVDLRGNGGGESDAADYFLANILSLGADGPDGPAKPFYILTDGDVGSAAEAVTYDGQLRGVAVVVGARTYGAANNNRRFPIAPGFVLSVSYHRPIHPLSGTNWEGVGVAPDLEAPPEQALDVAELAATTLLMDRAPEDSPLRSVYSWRADALRARITPPELPQGAVQDLVGSFGPIEIRKVEGALTLHRADRPRWPQGAVLTPMSDAGLFAVEGTETIRLQITPEALRILRPNAPAEVFQRSR